MRSDGVLSPADLARRAHSNGVRLWALTDHDELSGLSEAVRAASELGMAFVPGVEISVTWAARTVHIVGLGVDPDHAALKAGLDRKSVVSGKRVSVRVVLGGRRTSNKTNATTNKHTTPLPKKKT